MDETILYCSSPAYVAPKIRTMYAVKSVYLLLHIIFQTLTTFNKASMGYACCTYLCVQQE